MYRVLYTVYNTLQKWAEDNKTSSIGLKFCQLCCALIFYYMNIVEVFILRYGVKKNKVNSKTREESYIISLTTFPARIDTVWITIETLLRQTFPADKIVLWLATTQFPNGMSNLPVRLLKMQKRGLEIRFCDDLKSYKKFYYSMQEYSNANIITADDDCFYPIDFVESLVEMHQAYSEDVVCRTAPQISPVYSTPPSKWHMPLTGKVVNSYKLSINTGSGSLFPPGILCSETFNKNVFQKICPYADDLWLTVMAHISGTRVTRVKYYCYPIVIRGSQNESLVSINRKVDCDGINNDTQWENLVERYKEQLLEVMGDFFGNYE